MAEKRYTKQDVRTAKAIVDESQRELDILTENSKLSDELRIKHKKRIDELEKEKNLNQDILDLAKEQSDVDEKAAAKKKKADDEAATAASQQKADFQEIADLGFEIAQGMKLQGAAVHHIEGVQKNWIGMAHDLTQSTKGMTALQKKYHSQLVSSVPIIHDIYEQTENIGTEEFQNHDLTKQIATAKKMVAMHEGEAGEKYQATLKALEAAKKINDENVILNKKLTAAAKEMVKPFEALDSLIRKMPFGDLIAEVLGVDRAGKKMTEGFMKFWKGKEKISPDVGGPEDQSFEAGMDWNQFQTAFAESQEGPTTSEQRSAAYQKYQSGDLSKEAGGGRDTGYPAGYDEGKEWQEGFEDGKAGVKDKSKDVVEDADTGKKSGGLFSDGFLSGIAKLPKLLGGIIMGGITGALNLIVKVIKGIVTIIVVGFVAAITIASKILFGMVKSGFAMQKELGIGVGHAISLNAATREAAAGGFMYGEKMEDSWKRAQDLVEEWGVINKETERSVSVASDLERTYGVSTTAAAQLAAVMAATSDSTKDVLMADMGKEMKVLQKSGIPVGKVMEEIAADTDFFAGHMKDGGKNIFKAAAWAKRLGMSMSTISGSAEKLLDWETSINAEMEASVLLGRSVNMERARQLFFDGKHEAAMKAIMQQVGSEADFTAMNLAQRESLAEAAGMSLTDLSKMVAAEGTLARMTYEERLEHEKKNKISANLQKIWGAIVNTFRKLYMNYITPIGKHLMKMMGFSGDLTGNFEMAGKAAKFIEKHVGGILKWVKDTSIEFIDWIKKIGTTEEGVFSLKKMFSGLWTATKEKAVEFFDYLVTKVPEVMDKIVAKFQEWWTKLDGITKLIIGLTIAIPLIAPLLIPIGGAISAIFTSLTGGLTALGAGGVLALKGVGILIAVFAGLAAGIYLVGKAMDTAGDGFGKFVDLYARTFLSFLKGITVAIVELVPHVVNLAAIVGGVLIDAFTIFKDLVIGVIDAITGLVVGTFTSIYTTFERFAKIGREGGLGMAAIGIVEIGAALAGFGVGSAIGGVFSAIGDFFGGDQLKKFEKFSEIAPSLAEAGLGISQIADGMDRISKIKVNKLADIGNTFKVNFGEAAADISIRQDEKTSKKMDKLIELLSESDGEGRKTREALKSISTIEIEAQHMEMGKLKSAISDIRRSF